MPGAFKSPAAEAPAAVAPAEPLREFATKVFERVGVPADQARSSSDALLYASLRGVDTHGVRNLKRYYVDGINRGEIVAAAEFRVEHQTAVSMRIDGDNGLGMACSAYAMEAAISMAKQGGVGLVAVNNSNHFGAAGAYAQLALDEGMIGISLTGSMFATGRERAVVPAQGVVPIFGTNPISVGFPGAEEPPFLLDMATSVVPQNRVEMLASEGLDEIPVGWAVQKDADGSLVPATDPASFHAVLPVGGTEVSTGGHKGSGLAMVVEGLTAVLSGAWKLHQVGELAKNDPEWGEADETEWEKRSGESERYDQKKVAHFVGAIRPDLFQPFDEFTAAMDGMVRVVKNTPPRPGVERVVYPGQVEHETLLQRSEHGIPLAQVVVDDLRVLAEMYGLADELVLLPPPPPPPVAPPAAAAPAAGAKL